MPSSPERCRQIFENEFIIEIFKLFQSFSGVTKAKFQQTWDFQSFFKAFLESQKPNFNKLEILKAFSKAKLSANFYFCKFSIEFSIHFPSTAQICQKNLCLKLLLLFIELPNIVSRSMQNLFIHLKNLNGSSMTKHFFLLVNQFVKVQSHSFFSPAMNIHILRRSFGPRSFLDNIFHFRWNSQFNSLSFSWCRN